MFMIIDIWCRRLPTVLLTWFVVGSMAMAADNGSAARDQVKQVTSRVLQELALQDESLRGDPQRMNEFIDQLVLPYFDFDRMSRRVLGKRWKKASPEQRTRFVSAFRTLIVRTYASVLDQYNDQTLTYLEPVARKNDDEIVIPMQIESTGSSRPIQIAFAMHRDETTWKVFDVAVDGVSLVTNYRSSFRSEIARHGMDGLIARLEAKGSAAN